MGDISLSWFAKHYSVDTFGGLAQKAQKHWPPPPAVSIRSVLQVIGLPLQPDGGLGINIHILGMQDGEYLYSFSWTDPGVGTPIQATSWQWQLHDNERATFASGFASGTVQAPTLGPVKLNLGGYELQVTPVNEFGSGPLDEADFAVTRQQSSATPTITASIDNDDVVTVAGHNFNKGQAVNIQVTVKGSISTPNVAPNNAQDLRNQYATAVADTNNGAFSVKIAPQGFGGVQFENGAESYVLTGESISIIAKNSNVGSFSPGPGVSNVVTIVAPSAV